MIEEIEELPNYEKYIIKDHAVEIGEWMSGLKQ